MARFKSAPAAVVLSLIVVAACTIETALDCDPCGDTAGPADVLNLVAAAGDGEVTLTWTNPEDPDSAGFLVLRRDDGTHPQEPADPLATSVDAGGLDFTPGQAVTLVDGGLTNGLAYSYTVYTVDEAGNFSLGGQGEATLAPDPPSLLLAHPESGQVILRWGASTGATRYDLYRMTDPAAPASEGTLFSDAASPLVDGGLPNENTYYYLLTASNAGGESRSFASARARPIAPRPGNRWSKHAGNPLFGPGAQDEFDQTYVRTPIVIPEADTLRLYYHGGQVTNSYDRHVGLATSTDGADWTRNGVNPIFGADGNYNVVRDLGSVLKLGATEWLMYYVRYPAVNLGYKIYRATSADGISWTETGMVLQNELWSPRVYYDSAGSTYHMYYRPASTGTIYHATSADGIAWTVQGQAIGKGPAGNWDSNLVAPGPVVQSAPDEFWMYFTGSDGTVGRVGLAFSTDGQSWTKIPDNPVLSPGATGEWDELGVGTPSVVLISGAYRMFFAGTAADGVTSRIGSAVPIAAGTPDYLFGDGTGFSITDLGGDDRGYAVATDDADNILIAGHHQAADQDAALWRLDDKGAADASFGGQGGAFAFDSGAGGDSFRAVTLDAAGNILATGVIGVSAAGSGDLVLFRLTPDGVPDPAFAGGTGYATYGTVGTGEGGLALALDGEGNIIVVGYANKTASAPSGDLLVVRFTAAGDLDTSFGAGGAAVYDGGDDDRGSGIALTPDGGIVVAGQAGNDMALWRFTTEGTLDPSFAEGGVVIFDTGAVERAHAVIVDHQGRIIVTGVAGTDMALWRFDGQGAPDAAFGGGTGYVLFNDGNSGIGYGLAEDGMGRILVTGAVGNGADSDMALVRYLESGVLDTAFNPLDTLPGFLRRNGSAGGPGDDEGLSIVTDVSGRILVAGSSSNGANADLVVWRFNP